MAAIGDISRFPSADAASRLPRTRRTRAPVGNRAGASRTDLKARLLGRAPRARRGRVGSDQDAGAAARLLPARQSPPRRTDRDRRGRPQARRALSGSCSQSEEDYAFKRQSLVDARSSESSSFAPAHPGASPRRAAGNSPAYRKQQERQLAQQAEQAYLRLVSDWKASRPSKRQCGRRTGARISNGPRRAKPRGRHNPKTCAFARGSPAPPKESQPRQVKVKWLLTFIRRSNSPEVVLLTTALDEEQQSRVTRIVLLLSGEAGVSAAGEAQLSSAWRRRRTTPIGVCLTSRPAGLGLNTVPRTPQRLALFGCWTAGAGVTTLDLADRGATWLALTPDARIACV